ncbi:Conserved hypothetical protein [gamma proteobacterium HdN1]|nr:Conserved hypothetical protein [gamma proteobacterium HdN1]
MTGRLTRRTKLSSAVAIAATTLLTTGCSSLIYKVVGDGTITFGKDYMVPYLLSTDDTSMGCAMGEAMTPLFMSFGTVTTPPDELSVLIYLVDGTCATQRAEEANLEYIRMSREHRIEAATDARVRSKRWHAIAAQRQYLGYQALSRAMGEPGGKCPNFRNEDQQMIWLLGSAVGLMSVLSDAQSGGVVGVPMDIAPKAERAAACLDNAEGNGKWWGLPMAIRSAIWTVVPGITPAGQDPWKRLDQAMTLGENQGVRLASALVGIIAYNSDNIPLTKDVIRRQANSIKTVAANREYRMVDTMATDMLTLTSDRLWTEATGARTPIGSFGKFWDDKTEVKQIDIKLDDLL